MPDEVSLREALALGVKALEHQIGLSSEPSVMLHNSKPFDDNSLQDFDVDAGSPKLALAEMNRPHQCGPTGSSPALARVVRKAGRSVCVGSSLT